MICFVTTFGEWLDKELKDQGIKKIDLARRTGVDSGAITRYIKGERFPDVPTLAAIADGLGINYEIIMRVAIGKSPTGNAEIDPISQELLNISIRLPENERVDLRDTGRAKLRRHERDRRTERNTQAT